jgi:hypothetical protein
MRSYNAIGQGPLGYNAATASTAGGTGSISTGITGLSGASGSESGLIASYLVTPSPGHNALQYFLFSVVNVGGTLTLEVTAWVPTYKTGILYASSSIYSAAYTGPIYIQINRTSSTTVNFYTSTDNATWTAVGTFTGRAGGSGMTVGVFANAGNTGSGAYGVGTVENTSVNAQPISLTDADYGNVGDNTGSWIPYQSGTLTDGHYYASGYIAISSGCPANGNATPIQYTYLLDNTLGVEIWAYSVETTTLCISGNCGSYSVEVPISTNNPYFASLTHGHTYTLTTEDYVSYAGNYTSSIVTATYTLNP